MIAAIGRRLSLTKEDGYEKVKDKTMKHSDATFLCTQIVEDFKGDKKKINEECQKVRDVYFSQYRITND